MLSAEHLTVRYDGVPAVEDLDLRVEAGDWWMVVGPNGAGKSTLVEALAGGLKHEGAVRWEGKPLNGYSSREIARKIAVLSQKNTSAYGFTVAEVVNLGRYAYRQGWIGGSDPEGEEKVAEALRLTGLTDMRERSMLTLSGGECQRAFLAQALAQDPELLMLDEPANHLDLPYQQQLFTLIGDWLAQGKRAVVSVMHDLSLARKYGTHALLMHRGRRAAGGPAAEVLTRERLEEVYGMDVYGWMRELYAQWE